MKQEILTIFLLTMVLFLATACQEAETQPEAQVNASQEIEKNQDSDGPEVTPVSISEDSEERADNLREQFQPTSYSQYILLHRDGQSLMIDYNFFPMGTDFDAQAKEIHVPCFDSEAVNLSVNVPTESGDVETSCDRVLSVPNANFTLIGIELPFDDEVSIFSEDYGFNIREQGFYSVLLDEVLILDSSAKLDDVF